MKKLLFILLALAYETAEVYFPPTGLSAESLLAGRAIAGEQIPYRDFFLHIGPLPAYLFAGLFKLWPHMNYLGCSFVFSIFTWLTAWAIYSIADRHMSKDAALLSVVLFLVANRIFDGTRMFPETIMTCFISLAWLGWDRDDMLLMIASCLLALATKQSAIFWVLGLGGICLNEVLYRR